MALIAVTSVSNRVLVSAPVTLFTLGMEVSVLVISLSVDDVRERTRC